MKPLYTILILACAVVLVAPSVSAQESEGSLDKRIELATKMHELRPAREQVDSAINAAAMRMPENERESFKAAMQGALNYKAIEKISIDAMAETFTEAELQAMLEYYSKAEARSVSDKYPQYQQKVGPEIIKMIDKAMMRVRTGASGQ